MNRRQFYCMSVNDFVNDIDYYYHRNERVKKRISRRFAEAMKVGADEVKKVVDMMSVAFDAKAHVCVSRDKTLDIIEEKVSCYFDTRDFTVGDFESKRIDELIAGFDANYLAWYASMSMFAKQVLDARSKKVELCA